MQPPLIFGIAVVIIGFASIVFIRARLQFAMATAKLKFANDLREQYMNTTERMKKHLAAVEQSCLKLGCEGRPDLIPSRIDALSSRARSRWQSLDEIAHAIGCGANAEPSDIVDKLEMSKTCAEWWKGEYTALRASYDLMREELSNGK